MAQDLEAIKERAARMAAIGYPEAAQRDEMDVVFTQDVPALADENRRLREALEPFAKEWNDRAEARAISSAYATHHLVVNASDCQRAAEVLK